MKITDIKDFERIQKKIALNMLLIIVIFLLSCCIYAESYYNKVCTIKQRFVCEESVCKIFPLNKKNAVLSAPKVIDRNTIGDMRVRHEDDAVCDRSLIFGTREHRYYLRFLPQNFDGPECLVSSLFELGPVSNEKYANKILEQLKNSIYTNKDINIEIRLGGTQSFR